MVFHLSLSDSKSPRVFRIPLSILADLNNAVVWMVSSLLLISTSSSPFSKPGGIDWTAPITIFIIVIMFISFFSSLSKSSYLSLFSLSLIFTLWYARTAKSIFGRSLFSFFFFFFFTFLFIITQSGWD